MPDMESFMNEFDNFRIDNMKDWYTQKGQSIGLYFAAFMFIFAPIGGVIGYFIVYNIFGVLV